VIKKSTSLKYVTSLEPLLSTEQRLRVQVDPIRSNGSGWYVQGPCSQRLRFRVQGSGFRVQAPAGSVLEV